jgi:zinc protease
MNLLPLVLAAALGAAAEAPEIPTEHYRLDNGMDVLLSHDPRLPVVAVEIRYRVGSAYEREGRSGFAHLFEHLMFQGSASYDHEYFKPFEPIGGDVNGTTSRDRTNYFERVPSNYLELALWMESDRMQSLLPALTQDKLDNQRAVVLNERRQRYQNQPYGMVWEYFAQALYPTTHPYGHTTMGLPRDIKAATMTDVRAFFEQYYVPANAVLTVAGDFEREQAQALIDKYFGGIEGGERAPTPQAATPTLDKIEHLVKTDDVKLPRIHLAWHTPALYAPGDAELDLLAAVLSAGKSSRLYQPLVYERKVAKDVYAYQVSQQLSSFFVIQATAAPEQSIEALAEALFQELQRALATPPSQAELARALNEYKKDFYSRVESVVSRASMLSTYFHLTGSADYIAEDLARYTGASPELVHAAAKRWLDLGRYARIDIVPGARAVGEK